MRHWIASESKSPSTGLIGPPPRVILSDIFCTTSGVSWPRRKLNFTASPLAGSPNTYHVVVPWVVSMMSSQGLTAKVIGYFAITFSDVWVAAAEVEPNAVAIKRFWEIGRA